MAAYLNRVRNPKLQARIFLPQWFIKVVRPGKEQPPDVVQFHVPLDMGKIDIKNYLEQIYDIPVAKVHTRIQAGKVKQTVYRNDAIRMKIPDVKVAYVTLKEGTFKFPDMFPPISPTEVDDDEVEDKADTVTSSEDNKSINQWFNI